MKGINKCPYCGAKGSEASHYRCGQRVKKCNNCGNDIMYYEVYKPYDKKIVEENPDYYSLIDPDGAEL